MAQVAGSPVAPMAAMTGVTERGCSTTRLRFASASGQPPTPQPQPRPRPLALALPDKQLRTFLRTRIADNLERVECQGRLGGGPSYQALKEAEDARVADWNPPPL